MNREEKIERIKTICNSMIQMVDRCPEAVEVSIEARQDLTPLPDDGSGWDQCTEGNRKITLTIEENYTHSYFINKHFESSKK